MSANDKAAAAFHPADEFDTLVIPDDDDSTPMGENPGLPPFARRSGAAAVFNALAVTDVAVKHAENLQAAVNEIRSFVDGRHTVGAVEIRNILDRRGV